MAEARDYLGTIATRKLDNTGVTQDLLRACQKPGTTRIVIMEVATDEVANTQGGQHKVKFKAGVVEMVPREQEDVAREFMRAIADSRGGDVALPGTEGQSIEDAASAVAAQIDRDDDGKPTGKGIWDGDPDAPVGKGPEGGAEVKVPANKATAKKAAAKGLAAVPDECPFKGCTLPAEHDGDHNAEGYES